LVVLTVERVRWRYKRRRRRKKRRRRRSEVGARSQDVISRFGISRVRDWWKRRQGTYLKIRLESIRISRFRYGRPPWFIDDPR
jgi:hypothetical protein